MCPPVPILGIAPRYLQIRNCPKLLKSCVSDTILPTLTVSRSLALLELSENQIAWVTLITSLMQGEEKYLPLSPCTLSVIAPTCIVTLLPTFKIYFGGVCVSVLT